MADLTEIQAAQAVKVVGSDNTGVEQTPVQSTANGALHTNLRNDAGTEIATASNPLRTDPTGTTTQPVSGIVTAKIQDSFGGNLSSNAGSLFIVGGDTAGVSNSQRVLTVQGAGIGSVPHVVNVSQSTLPTGAATETTLAALNTKVTAVNTGAVTISTALPTGANSIGTVAVSNFPASQAVTGTFFQSTQPISAVSLPLPTGAATSTQQSDGTQKTQIVDGVGAVIDSISSGGSDNLLVAFGATNYAVSTVNSTTVQLAAGATFTGAVETAFAQQSFSILIVSDQNGTLTVKQYIDAAGLKLASSIAYSVTAGTGFARSGVVNGNYISITFQNNGGVATTTLQIDTAYGTIPSATQLNNSPIAINEINGLPFLTSVKGVQATNALPVQQLNNAGRNARHFILDAYTAAPAIEAVQSVVQWYGNAAVAGTTQPAVVPAGKTLRLQSWTISTKSLATVGSAVVRVRVNTAGLGVLASPLAFSFEAGSRAGATTNAMTGGMDTLAGVFPEGFEIPAGAGLAFSMAGYGPTGVLALQGVTRFQVQGYEY